MGVWCHVPSLQPESTILRRAFRPGGGDVGKAAVPSRTPPPELPGAPAYGAAQMRWVGALPLVEPAWGAGP